MSEMFTKCNGFIVSGDPLVYADSATMTGQGTVSEPFGVKSTDLFVQEPLYTGVSGNSAYIGWRPDETVLYSGDLSQGNKDTITLSEPVTNFEKFKVYGAWNYNNDCRMYSQIEIDTVNSGLRFDLNTFGPVLTTAQATDGNCYFTVGSYKFNSPTAIDVVNAVRFHTNLGAFSNSDTIKIYKVIGINRKV